MAEEAIKRLENVESEIERLRGEFVALRNVLVGALRDTFRVKPEVFDTMIRQLEAEIDRLDNLADMTPTETFRKEGAQQFYREFTSMAVQSVRGEPPSTDQADS